MKNNIILGIILSIGIVIMQIITRLSYTRDGAYIDVFIVDTFAMLIITWFGHLWLIENKKFNEILPNTWFRSVISVLIVTIIVYHIMEIVSVYTPLHFDKPRVIRRFRRLEDVLQTRSFLRVFTWNIVYYFILFLQKSIEEKKNAELEASRAKELALETKLSFYREQLSPHFMFNSLNALASITEEAPVHNFVDKLAGVYHYLLTSQEKKEVTVKEELEFVEKYWHILKERFGDAIELKVEFFTNTNKLQIPPMTFQILIENATKHNIATNRSPLVISIIENEEEIIVSNNIQIKVSTSPSLGIGLNNLTERYRLLYNKEVVIIQNDNFIVKLPKIKL